MNRQLSQQEIDGVLRAKGVRADQAAQHSVPFDFRRPDRIPKSQVRAIQFLHEDFARNLAMSLGAYLRSFVTVNVSSVEQLKYGEFLEGIPLPTCVVSLSLRPYDGNALIEVTPNLIFPILDLILGGKGKEGGGGDRKREITNIEKSLLDTFFRIVLKDLKEAWKGVAVVNFKIEAIENDPQMLQMLSSSEVVVAIGVELRVGENAGTLNLAIPATNIKIIGQKFDRMARKVEPTEAGQARMLDLLRPADLTCDARLLGPMLTIRDLLAAEIGDCLQFDCPVDHPLDLLFNGNSRFRGGMTGARNHRVFAIEQPTLNPFALSPIESTALPVSQ